MFGNTYSNPARAYARVEAETSVEAATPHQLIMMLYDGALMALRTAGVAMQNNDIPTKGLSISKAIDIILNGLKVSLDVKAGGELAERLDALYTYMAERLVYANANNSETALNEVISLLDGLRDAWRTIGGTDKPAAEVPHV